MESQEQKSPSLRTERTRWKHRLIVWPGMPFRTFPFPYLLHRFSVTDDNGSWWGGFFRRGSAKRWIKEAGE